MSRRLPMIKTCAYAPCGQTFRPFHKPQQYCCHRCAALQLAVLKPHTHNMAAANAANKKRYAKRLGEQIKGMTKGEIWRLSYNRGWSACYWSLRRRGLLISQPVKKSA